MSIDIQRLRQLLIRTTGKDNERDIDMLVNRFINDSEQIDRSDVKREISDIEQEIDCLEDTRELLFLQLNIKRKYDDYQEQKRQQEQKEKERHERAIKNFMEKVEKLKSLPEQEKKEKMKIAIAELSLERKGLLHLLF